MRFPLTTLAIILAHFCLMLFCPVPGFAGDRTSPGNTSIRFPNNHIERFNRKDASSLSSSGPTRQMSFKGTTAPPQPHQKLRSKERSGATPFGLPDIRSLIKKVNQSVVAIRMLDSDDSWSLSSLGLKKGDDSKPTGYGAGFIVSPDGHIITNEHVLKSGAKIEVELLGGEKYKGRSIQTDKKNDLALIKIDCDRKLKPVALGNSRSVEIGEWVVGIGNPYGIGQSIMVGVVSAKSRKIPGSGYPPLIQIDAAMNLGNSGGPLFNMAGEVIGVNTILLWKSQGIGFATPSNVAVKFMRMASSSGAIRSASAMRSPGPRGPTTDRPRRVGGAFNALDPPWKRGN